MQARGSPYLDGCSELRTDPVIDREADYDLMDFSDYQVSSELCSVEDELFEMCSGTTRSMLQHATTLHYDLDSQLQLLTACLLYDKEKNVEKTETASSDNDGSLEEELCARMRS